MKKLTTEDIKRLSERPDVNKVAVEDFLSRMSICNGMPIIMENLIDDAKSHKWSNETIEAILDGILDSSGMEIDDLLSEKMTL